MKKQAYAVLLFFSTLLVSCNTEEAKTTTQDAQNQQETPSEAEQKLQGKNLVVEQLEVMVEPDPLQAHILVTGYRINECTNIHNTNQTLEGNTVTINFETTGQQDADCPKTDEPFAHTIPVEMANLKKGTYKLRVLDKETEFTLP